MRPRRSPTSHGYTLLELTVVLSIVVLLLGMGAPHYLNSLSRYRAELAARRIADDLRLARAQALATSTSQTVSFDVASSSYTLTGIISLDRRLQTYTVSLATSPYICAVNSANFNGTAQVTFDPYGSADNGGQVVVQAGDFQRTVLLEASTGKATVP